MPLKLAGLMVTEGAVTAEAMDRAQIRHRVAGGSLDTALLELGGLDEDRAVEYLARASGLPPAPAVAWDTQDAKARRAFPGKIAEKYGMAPFRLEDRQLSLVSAYPVDLALLDEISFMLSLHVRPHIGPEWRVRKLIARLYGTPLAPRFAELGAKMGAAPPPPSPEAPLAPAPPVLIEPVPPAALAAAAVQEPTSAPGELAAEVIFSELARQEAEPGLLGAVAAASAAVARQGPDPLRERTEPSPAPPDRSAPPRWSLGQARGELADARSRDAVVVTALRYARDFFEYAACFAVLKTSIAGYDALGPGTGERDRVRELRIPPGEPHIFRTVVETRGPYLGPVPRDAPNDTVLKNLGRAHPRTALLYPVLVRNRVVAVVYADNGEAPVSPTRLSDFLLFAGSLTGSFETLIRDLKRRAQARERGWRAVEPARAAAPEPKNVEIDLGDFEVALAAQALAAPEALDATRAVDRLVESPWGSREREQLVDQLAQKGADAVRALVARFPGPVEAGRVAYAEAPPVEEHGPVLAALVALGHAATAELVPLLRDEDPERRYYATLVLGRVGDPAALQPLAERVFDPHPKNAYAARAVLSAARKQPGFPAVAEKLRRAAAGKDPDRAALAARALGKLRDVEAVPALIDLVERAGDEAVQAAAADALHDITLQQHGTSGRRWREWWKDHQGRPRADWLLAALTHKDRDVRLAAAEELRTVAPPPIEYFADGPAPERDKAAQAWASLVTKMANEL